MNFGNGIVSSTPVDVVFFSFPYSFRLFAGADGGLHTWSSGHALGVELCGDTQETCRYAPATASGDTLRIADDGKPATRVRYAWINSPVVNLYDARALPAPGFELPITQ